MRFADTSFWCAAMFARDDRHLAAKELIGQGLGKVVTSDLVVGETWTVLCRRIGHHRAVEFLDFVTDMPAIEVAAVDSDTVRGAWVWLRRHSERVYSFVDATSFAIMRHRRIREALAFDGDFSAAGFVEARPA